MNLITLNEAPSVVMLKEDQDYTLVNGHVVNVSMVVDHLVTVHACLPICLSVVEYLWSV